MSHASVDRDPADRGAVSAAQRWVPAYIGVGSNLAEPAQQVRRALEQLAELPATLVVAHSRLYGNPPLGPQDQPDYVNAAAGLLTRLPAAELLRELQALESTLGRVRVAGDRWGPRIIDLDLLVYGTHTQDEAGLTLPHPGISERNFVLFPLLDIAPALQVPGQGLVAVLAAHSSSEGLAALD